MLVGQNVIFLLPYFREVNLLSVQQISFFELPSRFFSAKLSNALS